MREKTEKLAFYVVKLTVFEPIFLLGSQIGTKKL